MTTSLLRRAAAATAGLAAVLSTVAVAAPASAEVFSKTDPAGDVLTPTGEAPGVRQGDIRKVRFEHARRVVTLRVGYRALNKVGAGLQQYVTIRTPAQSYEFFAIAQPGDWQGQLLFSGADCRGAELRFDYRDDVFALSVPRGCLGNPRWVQVGVGTTTSQDGEEVSGFDDALQRGQELAAGAPVLSPRLSRAGGSYTG